MANGIRLYFRYVAISVRGQLQYRAAAMLQAVGQFAITAIEFLTMWALFDRFGDIRGWTLPEVALLYGMAHVSFAVSEAAARGFDSFSQLVRSGDFDRLLLRPRSTAFQVAASSLQLMRTGRLVQGVIVIGWAVGALSIAWTVPKALLLGAGVLSGSMIFFGLFVFQATVCFWTTQGLELMNTTTYGGVETSQYPLSIYEEWFRRFFTFIVPLACGNYFPVLAITGHPDPLHTPAAVLWLSPLAGPVFLFVTLRFWRVGVRHYRSTGS